MLFCLSCFSVCKTEQIVERKRRIRSQRKGYRKGRNKGNLVTASVIGVMERTGLAPLVAVGTVHALAAVAGNTGMGEGAGSVGTTVSIVASGGGRGCGVGEAAI